jgi:hypothetical protein
MRFAPSFTSLARVAVGGCSSGVAVDATIYNGCGQDVVLELDGHEYKLSKGEKWHGAYRRKIDGPEQDPPLRVRLDGQVRTYERLVGPTGCYEFPTTAFCQTLALRRDGKLWYAGGTDPRLTPPYDTFAVAQPAGFPIEPWTSDAVDSTSD